MDYPSKLLHKPNDAIVMMPRTGKLTPSARKIYNVLLHHTQAEVTEFREQGRVVSAEHLFSSPLTELVKRTIAPGSQSEPTTALKGYFREMRRIEVDWEAPDASSGVVWRSMGLLSEAQIEKRGGVLWALWALPPTLLVAVSDPARFTLLDLEQISRLDKYGAIALYEICARYRNNPTGVSSRNSIDWWTDALSNVQAAIDPATGERTRREWRKFKREIVAPAILEVNAKTDITIELIEFKSGRAVSEVQFSIQRKPQEASDSGLPKVPQEIAELAAQCSIALNFVARAIKNGAGEGDVKIVLLRILARTGTPDGTPIDNRQAYFRSVLADLMGRTKPEYGPPPTAAASHQLPFVEQIKTPQEERRAQYRSEFKGLPQDEQQVFLELAYQQLKDAKMVAPTLARKVAQGEWSNPLLISKGVEVYAKQAHGAECW